MRHYRQVEVEIIVQNCFEQLQPIHRRTHEVSFEQACRIAGCPTELAKWRTENGFTEIPSQCGYCLKVIKSATRPSTALTLHRRLCKSRRLPPASSTSNESSTFETSDQTRKTLSKTQEKNDRILMKTKARVLKLETKVKKLKIEKNEISQKYVKLLEKLLNEKVLK